MQQPSNRRESMAANRRRSSSAAASTSTPTYPWSKRQLQITAPFFPRKYLAATSAFPNDQNSIVYLFGGASDTSLHNDLVAVDPITLATQFLVTSSINPSATPSPRRGHTMAQIQGHLYVFGGTDHTGQASDDALYVYDIANNMWTRPNLHSHSPQCRHMHSVSVVGTKFYIFGGMTHGYYLNDVVVFDSANLHLQPSWQFMEPAKEVPPGRTGHSAVVHQEKIYIFGGTDGLKVFDDLWCYDTRNNTWQCLKGSGYIPPSRYGHATCIVQDVMYVFAGRNGSGQGLNDLFAYRFAANRWFTFQKMGPPPSARAGACLVPCGSKIFVFGGSDSDDPPSVVSCLDTAKIRYPPDGPPVRSSRSNPQLSMEVRTVQPRTSSVPSFAGTPNALKRLTTSLLAGRNGFGPPQPVPPGISQGRQSVLEIVREVPVPQDVRPQYPHPSSSSGAPQPIQSPRPEPTPNRPPTIGDRSQVPDPRIPVEKARSSTPPVSRPLPERKESRIFEDPSQLLKQELVAKNVELEKLKNKLNWLSAEFYSSRSTKGAEEKDVTSLLDHAGQDGEKAAVYAVLLKLRKELHDAKAMIAQTSETQTKRLAESEHIRTAALCEAAYQKARAEALAEENKDAFLDVDLQRTRILETRLVDVLKVQEKQTIELESLQAQTLKHSEVARHADAARRGAEERAERMQATRNDTERSRVELEERLRIAEAKVSELSSNALLAQDVQDTMKRNEDLERSLAEQGSALALAAQILEAANNRADDADSKSESVQASNFQLQRECGVMRTQIAELEAENRSLKTYAEESKSMLNKLKERSDGESILLSRINSWRSSENLSRSSSLQSDASTDTLRRKVAHQEEERARHESLILTEKRLRETAEKRNRDLEAMYERARDEALLMRDECRLRAEENSVARREGESVALRLKETISELQVVKMKLEKCVSMKDVESSDTREKIAALERKSAMAIEESRELETLHAEAQEEIRTITERNLELERKIQSLVSQNSTHSTLTARAEEAERQLAATKTSLQAKASKLENDTYQAIQMVRDSESKLLSMQSQLEEARTAAQESEKQKLKAEAEAESAREKYEKATTVTMNSQSENGRDSTTLNKEREAWESTKQVLEKRITMLAEMNAETGNAFREADVSKELEAANDALEARLEELTSDLALAIEERDALKLRVEELLKTEESGESYREELELTLEKVQSLDEELTKVKSSERAHYQRGMQSEKAASQLASRMAALSQEIAEANDRVEELTHENQTLLAEIEEMDRGRSIDAQSQTQEITRVTRQFEELARDHQELLGVLGEMESKLEAAESESQTQESQEQIEEMTREHQRLLAELEAMETKLEESDRILADSQTQASEEVAQGKEQIEELLSQLEKLKTKVETADRGLLDSESHAQEIARANQQVEEMNQVHETLLAELEDMEIKLEAADQNHADAQTRATEEMAECKYQIEELTREREEILSQLEEMEARLEAADQNLAESQLKAAEEVAQANARIEELTLEREELLADVNAADQSRADSHSRATEELADCISRNEELSREHQELLNQLEEMEIKLENADQSLVESQTTAAEEISQANARIEELILEREKLIAEVNAMETELESKDQAESQANDLLTTQAELAIATEKLWEADQRYEESTRVIQETQEELESLRQEHLDVSEAAEGLQRQVAELMDEREILTRESAEIQESLRREHRDALQVVEGLEQQVAEFLEQRDISTQLIQDTEEKLDLLREEHREALEEAASLKQQVADLMEGQEISTRLIQEAEEKLESLREERQVGSEDVTALTQKVADITAEREISNQLIQEAEERLESLREELREESEGAAALAQEVAELTEEREISTRAIQEAEEKLERLQEEGSEGISELKQQVADLLEEREISTGVIQETEEKLQAVMEEHRGVVEGSEDLKQQIAGLLEVKAFSTQLIKDTEEQLESLRGEYQAATEGADALKRQILEISEDQAQKSLQLQSTISDLESQLAESKASTEDLEDEVQRLSEVLQKNLEALTQQDERVEALNRTLKETELERDQAVEKASVLDSRVHEAASSKIEIQEKVAALHERLAKVRSTAVEGKEKEDLEE